MGSVWSMQGGAGPPPQGLDEVSSADVDVSANYDSQEADMSREDETDEFYEKRKQERATEIEKFKTELEARKKTRTEVLANLSRQIETLRAEKQGETELRERAELEVEELKKRLGQDGPNIADELESLRLQLQESKLAWECEKNELEERALKAGQLEKQVLALKDVANIGKQILAMREKQVDELNKKLKVIEATGAEYEKEVENIRKLRALYEERSRAVAAERRAELERERARTSVAETRLILSRQENSELEEKNKELESRLATVERSLDAAKEEVSQLRIDLATKGEKLYHVTSQMTIVNTLFTQVLEGPDMDFDRLASLLEENHDLINDLTAKGKMEEVASVLLEIAGKDGPIQQPVPSEPSGVAENLTKVWRVLVELLSHHRIPPPPQADQDASCYKSVETPRGPRMVISASRTYLKLKDLILEKNSLVKEVGRLKTLNGHLEERLEQQEDRLSTVTSELHKTWSVVGALREQHKQLHTQEKILRFELKHKREMLTELKKELEICREQWELARQKNVQTEEDWRVLRAEFASRKQGGCSSTESGYEDEEATASPVSDVEMAEDSLEEEENEESEEKKLSPEAGVEEGNGFQEGVKGIECTNDSDQSGSEVPGTSPRGRTVLTPEEIAEVFRIAEITDESIIQPDDATNLYNQVLTLEELEDLLQMDEEEVEDSSKSSESHSESIENEHSSVIETFPNNPQDSDVENVIIETGDRVEVNEEAKLHAACETSKEDEEGSNVVVGEEPGNSLISSQDVVEMTRAVATQEHVVAASHLTSEEETNCERADSGTETVANTSTEPVAGGSSASPRQRTAEEMFAAREARLQRLEEQCKCLFSKMSSTSQRGDMISNRLEELHEQYGEAQGACAERTGELETPPQPPVPPPMPPPPPPPMPPRRNRRT